MFMVTFMIGKIILSHTFSMIEHNKNILSHAIEGIAQINHDGYCTFANKAFCDINNILPDTLSSCHWQETIHTNDIHLAGQKYQTMMSGNTVSMECRAARKDKEVYHLLTMVPEYDANGKIRGHYCFVRDITAQKKAEIDAKQKHIELRQVFDHLPVVVKYKDCLLYTSPSPRD